MKKFAAYFLILLPNLVFGQLFPKVDDFRGNIRRVVEKKYGREVTHYTLFKAAYRPSPFSGWKYTYNFDDDSKLVKRLETSGGEIKSEYVYERKQDGNRQDVLEIATDKTAGHEGDYLEYENFLNANGQIEKVNHWSYDAKLGTRFLFLIEHDAKYQGNKLLSFTRQQINEAGDTASTEVCQLFYNDAGKLIRLERTDVISGFKTVIYYRYNRQGFVDNYTVDLLTELQEVGKNQLQDIYYKYDRHGNWTRMYRGAGIKKQLETKRKIKYW